MKIKGFMKGEMHRYIIKINLSGDNADNLPLVFLFQQDNDSKHCYNIVKSWLVQEGINVLQWPPHRPDINPIKNLWGVLKRVVAQKN